MSTRLVPRFGGLAVLLIASGAQAALFDRGGGLIYDSVLDVTFMQDANYIYSQTPEECYEIPPSEEDPGGTFCIPPSPTAGLLSWQDANAYVDGLEYYDSVRDVTWDDWRLPELGPINGSTFNTSVSYSR